MDQKPTCPNCSQPLTYVRTRTHEKKWYCYACEKYTRPSDVKSEERFPIIAQHDDLVGVGVVDSHGVLIGRVREIFSQPDGSIRRIAISVENASLRDLLEKRGVSPSEIHIPYERVLGATDLVVLSDAFSLSQLDQTPSQASEKAYCIQCGEKIVEKARFCIGCGYRL